MSSRSLLVRRRFQFAVALSVGALLPWLLRGTLLPGRAFEVAASNTLIANVRAIVIAFWLRLSIETYPGIRRSYVILPSALTGHGIVVVWFLLTRFPTTELSWDSASCSMSSSSTCSISMASAIKNGQNAHVVERGNFRKIAQIIRGHQLAPQGLVEMSKAAHSTYLQSLANEQMLAAEYVDACE